MGIFDDINRLLKMKTAMAVEKAAELQGEAGAGLGMGVGLMMPAMFAEFMKNAAPHQTYKCLNARMMLKKMQDSVLTAGDEKELYYLPFWRMKVDIEGIELQSYADLVKIANIPKAPREEWAEQEIYFWSPAFKVMPDVFLRLSRQMTVYQLRDELEESLSDKAFHQVSLSADAALESIRFTLANIAVNRKYLYPRLPEIDIRLKERFLVYIPFAVKTNELIQPKMQFSIHKNAIKTGKNL